MLKTLCAFILVAIATDVHGASFRLDCIATDSRAYFGPSSEGEIAPSQTTRGDSISFDFIVSDGVIVVFLSFFDDEHPARVRVSLNGQHTDRVSRPEIEYANEVGGGNISLMNSDISMSSDWHRPDPSSDPMWSDRGWNASLEYGYPAPSGFLIVGDDTRQGTNGGYMEMINVVCADGFKDYRALEHALRAEFTNLIHQ